MTLPPGTKVAFAPQDGVEQLQPQIDALLEILGHPEAWVLDMSIPLDFLDHFTYPTAADAQVEFDRLLAAAGITTKVHVADTLVEIAQAILQDNPNWPAPRSIQ